MSSSPSPSRTTFPSHLPPPHMPFSDFQFAYDPALFPDPPPIPPSAELFSATETSDLFGFLDNFNSWDLDADGVGVGAFQQQQGHNPYPHIPPDAYAYPDSAPTRGNSSSIRPGTASSSSAPARRHPYAREPHRRSPSIAAQRSKSPTSVSTSPLHSQPAPQPSQSDPEPEPEPGAPRANGAKPLLSDPQKRMNHILSEQKRRNAIREGYAQLTTLLAPAGAPPGTGMPTRGRPKGSGARAAANGKGRPGAGKSGVLLRAVEYIHWLEEGRAALLEEVLRVEAAAGAR